MSCENCNTIQELNETTFYRWKNANVEIRGCKEHLLEIFGILNKKQKDIKIELINL